MIVRNFQRSVFFIIVLLIFFLEDIANIFNSVETMTRIYVAGVPTRDLLLIIMLFYFLAKYRKINQHNNQALKFITNLNFIFLSIKLYPRLFFKNVMLFFRQLKLLLQQENFCFLLTFLI